MTLDLPERIATERLLLRRPVASDGPALGVALSEALPALVPWFQWARALSRWGTPADLGVRASVLEHRNAAGLECGWLLWNGDAVVGEVALGADGADFGVLTYRVWLRPSATGCGVASQGSRAVLHAVAAWGRAEWVTAECASSNCRSRGLLTRLGFERFGSTRDHERYVWRSG